MLKTTAEPDIPELPNRRQIRTIGPNGNYWYVVELERNLKPGQVKSVRFWKKKIALYRDNEGELHALEDRCAHRQLPISAGYVDGKNVVKFVQELLSTDYRSQSLFHGFADLAAQFGFERFH